jgi:acyl-CoA hydrolase
MPSNKKTLKEVLGLFQPRDRLAVPLATGQPMGLLSSLSERTDWERLEIFTGLLAFPYPILQSPNVYVTSGYYGPIERFLNEQGAHVDYLPADFTGFEIIERRKPSRIVATTMSPPDAEGYLTFGTHGAAVDVPFRLACKDPDRIAIAEVNPKMPVVYGASEHGDNKIHVDEVDVVFDSDQTQIEVPPPKTSDAEKKIAENVLSLIRSGDTLQFGIGGIPNHVAGLLATSPLSDFGVHSELVSDGFLKLFESGKISNRKKGIFEGRSVFTFALGTQPLYDFLDERKGRNKRLAICLPVSVVNDPHVIARNRNLVSINSGFMIDFNGQVASEAIGLKQYSGVGGQLLFVQGAYASEGGRSVICIKSTVTVGGKPLSNIVPTLPPGSVVSTPRHYVQYVVTEYGIADLYGVPDELRAEKLIAIAHPDFRDGLKARYDEINRTFYKRA